MTFKLDAFRDAALAPDYLAYLVDQQAADQAVSMGRFWDYFRNTSSPGIGLSADVLNSNSRPYFQAQEVGLPARITGVMRSGAFGRGESSPTDLHRKEVVIENDIAWRIHTMVDFLFGRRPAIRSLAASPDLARAIESVIDGLFDANGGVHFFQEMALFGAIYGFVDLALRMPADGQSAHSPVRPRLPRPAADGQSSAPQAAALSSQGSRPAFTPSLDLAIAAARALRLETIEAPRIIPILDPYDYRTIRYWLQVFHVHPSRLANSPRPWLSLLGFGRNRVARPDMVEVIEIIGPTLFQRYEDRRLVTEDANILGRLPIVHIQNLSLASSYAGLSDVEPLIPLQDELNTRLSDRAHRVTYQSFKMYLGRGIDDFLDRPVGPGQMWTTSNLNASIQEFGSDAASPSEDAHIDQVRSALDKVSGVSPLAAGLVKGNIGNLTSATALRILLGGLIARTARKRLTYGQGIGQIIELALDFLDRRGLLRTAPADRRVEIHWPSSLPTDESEQLRNAQIKAQLGVPADRILTELGYGPDQTASDI